MQVFFLGNVDGGQRLERMFKDGKQKKFVRAMCSKPLGARASLCPAFTSSFFFGSERREKRQKISVRRLAGMN